MVKQKNTQKRLWTPILPWRISMWSQFLKSIKNSRKHEYINVRKVLNLKDYWFFFQKEKSNNCHLTTNQKTLSGRQYELNFLPQRPRSGFSSLRWVKKILKSGKIISTTQIKRQVPMKNSIRIGPRQNKKLH